VLRRHASALRTGRPRLIAAGIGLLVLGAIVPWPITISGPFAVASAAWIPITAPDSGFIAQVDVREGTRVAAGAPLLTIRNLELERQAVACRRVADSLTIRSARSRAEEQLAEVTRLEADRSIEEARSAGFREQIAALRVRALGTGVVVTPRPEELVGRWVSRGELVLALGRPDSVEVRIALKGPGASAAQAGQPVRLLSEATMTRPLSVQLAQVAAAVGKSQALEARVRLPAANSWRPGMTGRARVTLRHSNVLGALWWRLRRTIRGDILL
jgi:pyruvate/2-oxoglutarate dehydrogenase complex dihydrolipoamide acyltransferase (E2) component